MDAVPVIVRGHNVAVLIPPVVEAARPLLAAVEGRRLLVLTPDTDRAVTMADALEPAFAARQSRLVVVSAPARGARLLAEPHGAAVIGMPAALALLKQSALPTASYGAVALAWPEHLSDEARPALEAVMAEVDKDAQRILLTAEPGPATMKLIERYAFKAMTFGFPVTEPEPGTPTRQGPVGAARYVVAPAAQLKDVRRRVLDALALASDEGVVVATAPESRAAAETLIQAAGDTPPVIVAEPYQLPWLRSLFQPLTPLPVAGSSHEAEERAEAERAKLAGIAESEDLSAELLSLAPLLRRFDAALIAAAALRQARAAARHAPAQPAAAPGGASVGGTAKIWVGIGKKDNVRPGDIVATLANQAQITPDLVGRIEVRDLFCLVEVRADQAERAAKALTGTTIKGRRLVARVDQGPGAKHKPPRRA